MSRTQGRSDCDTPFTDGWSFRAPITAFASSGTVGWGSSAFGNEYMTIGNSQTVVLSIPVDSLIARCGTQDDLQEVFGSGGGLTGNPSYALAGSNAAATPGFQTRTTSSTAKGSPVAIPVQTGTGLAFTKGQAVLVDTVASGVQEVTFVTATAASTVTVEGLNNAHATNCVISSAPFTTPAGVSGRPPYSGVSALTPVTSPRPKGLMLTAIYPVYTVTGLALTTNTIGISATTFANNTAPAITPILAVAANGLQTAIQANPYVTPILVPNPVFVTTKLTDISLQWNITTGATGTANIYGIFGDVTFNYN